MFTAARIKPGTTLPLGGLALQDRSGRSIKKAEKIVKDALDDLKLLKGGEGRTFYAVGGTWRALAQLHMAQTGLSAARHARLRHPRQGGAGVLPAGAPGPSGHAVADRGGERRPPSAAALCGAGAGAHRAQGRAARGGVLGARRARGPAVFAARRRGAQEGRAARGRAGVEPAALALAAARRGADRLDRRLHGDVRHRRERRGEAAAPRRLPAWPTSAGARIPITAASSR